MFEFEKCFSSFISDEYENLNDLLLDSTTLRTVNSLKSIQAIQLLIPKLSNNQNLILNSNNTINYFINGSYNKHDDSLKYLLIKNTPIHFILHPQFLLNYVKEGQLHIQTDDTLNELDNYLTLTPDSQLLICVNQLIYTKLGLVGKLAYGYKKKFNLRKYIIEIDLKNNLIYEFNSNYYQRIYCALKNCDIKLDLLIKWIPNNVNCSSLSLIRFFDKLKYQQLNNDEFFNEQAFQEITIHQCGPNLRKFELDQFEMPNLNEFNRDNFKQDQLNEINLNEDEFKYSKLKTLIDSFGLALSGSYLPDDNDEVNTFRLDKNKLTNLICLEITGFFTLNNIRIILSELFDLIKHNNQLQYTVLIVNGFENSIRSWSGKSNQHFKHLSGENLYGICLSRQFSNFIWRVSDQNDFGIEKL